MKRFVIVLDATREVVRVANMSDGQPPVPRTEGYSVYEIRPADPVQLYWLRNPDGSFRNPKAGNAPPEDTQAVSHDKQRGAA